MDGNVNMVEVEGGDVTEALSNATTTTPMNLTQRVPWEKR